MELSNQEINRNRAISATVTLFIFALFILFLILFKLITPNPPFPESGGGGGQELALGMMNVGNDQIDFGSMGKVTDVVTKNEDPKETIQTVEGGENVQISKTKPELKNNTTVITPVKPQEVVKEKTELEKILELKKKNAGKNGGGIGDNQEAGESGDINGDPFKDGVGGTGTGTGGGDGSGTGTGTGSGNGPGFGT